IARAVDNEIVPSLESRAGLGVDVSRSKRGDMNTVYKWQDGKLRFVDAWNEPNAMNTARKVHDLAMGLAVTEVRIDGVGLGGPIADRLREFSGGSYDVI